MKKHATFAPSAAYRWKDGCPGSINQCKDAPPQFESKYAIEGSNAHSCTEYVVKRFKNLKKAQDEASKKWNDEMVEHATTAAKIIYDLRPSPSAKLLIENRVTLEHVSKRLYGSLDYAWVEDWGKLVVIDYKYGAGHVVLPNENPQLMIYATGLAKKYNYEFDSVTLVIIQPRTGNQGGTAHIQWTTSIKRIKEFEGELKTAIQAAKQPDAPLIPGDWCRWCPALTKCPAVSKEQMEKADIVFDVTTGIEAMPDPKGLSTEKNLSTVLDACNVLELWIAGVRERALQLVESGKPIKGWKVVPTRPSRVWLERAEKLAKRQFGSMAFETKFLSPAQLEKSVGKNAAQNFIEKNAVEVSSGVKLVSENSKESVFDLDGKED